ncbi:SusD/RagB family nutrient-binding outer membrane lipoprotein [Spirosoma sp. HMF4905]|uniref:SusD/RagB family nutrient-binding outer membrane lipoprotein n=1 Tax=Spirosoma arboris TaxID=2682092 RepID=A0A7K1S604_9BACT|nr:SusD/RagB family nutrient-binding outer membrane lipoprotein [Spirosoma arboris]MVM29224.1 SusD/RagB family nutrient-binding outer membrane lipoprotein [Spirosoma arboris]
MKTKIQSLFLGLTLLVAVSACKSFDELLPNPNVAGEDKAVPPSLILPRIQFDVYSIGDGGPFTQVQIWNQYSVSNNLYYGGNNTYNWTTTATLYNTLKNVNQMDLQATKTLGTKANAFSALAKFYRAWIFVWQANRVGDTPASQAGQGLSDLEPGYDTQKAVFARSLSLLDSANTMLASLAGSTALPASITGDIYYNNDLTKWRKAINTFKLRVLIDLSKRATDNADLNIPSQFAAIVNNPTQYPIMTSNADNLNFVFNSAYNTYPHTPNDGNNQYQFEGAPYLNITTATQDPRTFVFATPAPAQLTAGKKVGDFTAYVGADISKPIGDLYTEGGSAGPTGKYSYTNNLRYYGSVVGPEPYIIMGYSEMNFNIAEAINRGWVSGASAESYYLKGINASLSFYGLTEGQTYTIGDQGGKLLGTTTLSISTFLANPGVVYKGDNADGLEQILNQKYVSMHQNSGYEALYNWRRTGFPKSFVATGGGINSTGKIPRRWQYPVDEQTYNTANYKAAVMSQFNGTDDLNMDTWLTK